MPPLCPTPTPSPTPPSTSVHPALLHRLTLTTWNASALFGSRFAARAAVRSKMTRFMTLLRSSDVVCIQEAHGHPGDLNTLVREAPSHTHFGSFAPSQAAGGVLISLRNEFVDKINTFEEVVLSPGWCLALRCSGPQVAVQIICVHIEPALTFADKTKLLTDILACARDFEGNTFLLGDWNFVHSDEARFNIAECRDVGGDAPRGQVRAAVLRLLGAPSGELHAEANHARARVNAQPVGPHLLEHPTLRPSRHVRPYARRRVHHQPDQR
jgi:exonuclease III